MQYSYKDGLDRDIGFQQVPKRCNIGTLVHQFQGREHTKPNVLPEKA